ncbi:(deoxy)nucleoside triphosphate pyrophosphohydrolase [Sphingomonas sp. LR60]|uniref:(deoxy)nucleoside triphosphate pyrophosphohydrolase n=1 Tax=Sphingomonas sp. LR60 TaxID=3050233 RepID=UPI002FE3DBFE
MLVVAVALTDGSGRCLMQQRPHNKRHGRLWEFPGGKVEPGEHPVAALIRELEEELAISVAVDALDPLGFATDMPVTMLLYRCTAWRGTPRPLAAQAFRWDWPEALMHLPMPPVDVPLLAALARALAGG